MTDEAVFFDTSRFSSMDDNDKYNYCVSEIAFSKTLWLSQSDTGIWSVIKDKNGGTLIPVWPNMNLAKMVSEKIDPSNVPVSLDLDVFKEKWVNGMLADGFTVAALPMFNCLDCDKTDGIGELEIISATPLRFIYDIIKEQRKTYREDG